MLRLRRSASLGQFPLNAFAGVQLCHGRQNALGVGRRSQKVCGFLKRIEVFEREHHNGLFAVASNDQRFVVIANAVHCAGEVCTNGGVGYCIYNGAPEMYVLPYITADRVSSTTNTHYDQDTQHGGRADAAKARRRSPSSLGRIAK